MDNLTGGFNLSPVQVDDLPGISDICQGQIPGVLTRGLEKCITDCVDPSTRHDIPRKLSLLLYLLPDADRKSAVWSQPRPLKVELAAGEPVDSGRVQIELRGGVVRSSFKPAEPDPVERATHSPVLLGVGIDDLIRGELEMGFKRASIWLLLDVADGRKLAAFERKVTIQIWVTADEDRESVQLQLKPFKMALARYLDEDRDTQRLYVNRGIAQAEADVYLPGEAEPRQQTAIGGADKFQS